MIDYNQRENNKAYWNAAADEWFGATALPMWGVLFATEDELQLFGDITGQRMLEIGCGSGHSLVYQAQHGAGELWGLDISEHQLDHAARYLKENDVQANLICSAMEDDCCIPENYFDVIYSVYALGWTSDLRHTLKKLASYLKVGGRLIFSWRHPMNGCTKVENRRVVFSQSCFEKYSIGYAADGTALQFNNYQMSDYINSLAEAGFFIEKLYEQTDKNLLNRNAETEKEQKAKTIPLSFVIRARKI